MSKKSRNSFFVKITVILPLIIILSMCAGSPGRQDNRQKPDGNLTITFLNDTHNHIFPYHNRSNGRVYGGAARWASILKGIISETGEMLFLHGGDMVTSSDPAYTLNAQDLIPDWERMPGYGYRGLLEVAVFGKLGLDAMIMGNHEYDYGLYWNYRLFSRAPFAVLSANSTLSISPPEPLYDPIWYEPYHIFQKGNFRIGVIGVSTVLNTIRSPQARMTNPFDAVASLVESLEKECDIILVLSHLGVEEDVKLADRVPGIDVIVGGHSHSMLSEPRIVNGTIITQARAFGEFIGRLDLEYENGALKDYNYQLITADFSVTEDPETKAWLEKYLYPITLEHALSRDGQGVNSLGDYITEAINKKFPSDAVVFKIGAVPADLPAGPVSAEAFFTSLWPYKSRRYGPEKELSPGQAMDIASGRAASALRFLLEYSNLLNVLISADLPLSVLDSIDAISQSRSGSRNDLFLRRFNANTGGSSYRVVMDLQSLLDLYWQRILTDSYTYEILYDEIIDVLLEGLF